MVSPEKSEEQLKESTDEPDFKSSFISVCVIGFVILVSWLGVWYLFISR